ncbi:MAG: hypothetical protein ACJ790_03920, partial [Myxococcaceae bacterium]
ALIRLLSLTGVPAQRERARELARERCPQPHASDDPACRASDWLEHEPPIVPRAGCSDDTDAAEIELTREMVAEVEHWHLRELQD